MPSKTFIRLIHLDVMYVNNLQKLKCIMFIMEILNGMYCGGITYTIFNSLDIETLKTLRLCHRSIRNTVNAIVIFAIKDIKTAIQYADKGFKVKYITRDINQKDVSALGNVHTLNLSFCQNITVVSALGNVHTLNLRYCKNITDVSALGNVHTLDLYGCSGIKKRS